jgi:hypothetical protein
LQVGHESILFVTRPASVSILHYILAKSTSTVRTIATISLTA